MAVAIFRARVRPDSAEACYRLADEMVEIARSLPGFISWKDYFAEDGERVSIHEWESAEHLRARREHPRRVHAQSRGREEFYEDYTLYVCKDPRELRFKRTGEAAD